MLDIYKHDVEHKISATGYSVRLLEKKEILESLKDKLLEESQEVFEAYAKEDKSDLKEELADVIEVIDAILFHNGIELAEVLAIRDAKKVKKGGFEKGIFLESIDYFDKSE